MVRKRKRTEAYAEALTGTCGALVGLFTAGINTPGCLYRFANWKGWRWRRGSKFRGIEEQYDLFDPAIVMNGPTKKVVPALGCRQAMVAHYCVRGGCGCGGGRG